MGKIFNILIQHFMALAVTFMFFMISAEVGIRLHLQMFDRIFWTFLILEIILFYLIGLQIFDLGEDETIN